MKTSRNRYNNGYIGTDHRFPWGDGRLTPSKHYNSVMDGYELNRFEGSEYQPPKEWRQLPNITVGEQRFAGVYAIYDDTNLVALNATTSSGNYIVDWGDGTTGSFASNTQANKVYTPVTYAGLTSEVFRNYKTIVITVTPATANLTSITLSSQYNQLVAGRSLPSQRSRPWLNIRVAGANITSMNYGNCFDLEQIEFVGINNITSGYAHFNALRSLRRIVSYYTGRMNRFDLAFDGTYNLRTIPQFDFSGLSGSAFGLNQIFYGAFGLQYIPWMDTSMVSTFVQTFYQCVSLRTIPPLDLSKSTDCRGMFIGCRSLEYVPYLNTRNCTNFSSMFQDCVSLRTSPALNTSNGTNFSLMFYDANFAESYPYDFSKGTNFDRTYYRIENLNKVPPLDVSSGITFSQMFIACPSLTSVDLTGITGASSTSNGRSFDYMFNQCSALRVVKGLCFANAVNFEEFCSSSALDHIPVDYPIGITTGIRTTSFVRTFNNMPYLKTIGNFNMSAFGGSTYSSMYTGLFSLCYSLMSIGLTGLQHNFSISSSQFGGTALNNLYSSLAVVGASGAGVKTVTVSGNWGATAAYGHNPGIAIAKGWSVAN
jgi:hypothetical protein